ncbi:MAG: ParA family protein [Chitinophagaceae bacterium]
MPVISVVIQKGGSGKTTTAVNLAAALQLKGKTILLVDADPQANLSQSFGISDEPERNLYTEIKKEINGEDSDVKKAIIEIKNGLSVFPASIELAGAELELISVYGRENIINTILQPVLKEYDFIFIDCPHAIGMLTVNALVASDWVLIPLQAEFLPLKGVYSFMRHYETIKKKLNKKLDLLGLLLTKFDERKTMNQQVRERLTEEFPGKVFETTIRTNIQLAKAQEAGKDIFSFDKHAHGAEDYMKMAEEFLLKL